MISKLKLIVFIAPLLMGGCAPTYIINYSAHDVSTFDLIDKRSQADKETTWGKLDGKYGISKFGDASFAPDRLTLLKSMLDGRYGKRLSAKRIEVTRLRTLVYRAPETTLDHMINATHGLQVYPGIPDPQKHWWLFEIAVSMDGKSVEKNIAKETPEVKFCASCNKEIASKATVNAFEEFVNEFGKQTGLDR